MVFFVYILHVGQYRLYGVAVTHCARSRVLGGLNPAGYTSFFFFFFYHCPFSSSLIIHELYGQ